MAELDLGTRRGWPAELLFLLERYPRASWGNQAIRGVPALGDLAQFWLLKHGSLRMLGAEVASTGAEWREGRLSAERFQAGFVPPLQRFLSDLESHHHVEDSHYFPIFRRAEARLARGFDVLEADHGLIHAQIVAVVETAKAFLPRSGPPLPDDRLRLAAEAYVAACAPLVGSLDRHLTDEEDLVIPLLAIRS